jgi:pyruvate/2-oxoglutarate dehydrogenase complex dihydrolipoamide dehydrogenase (E3) component
VSEKLLNEIKEKLEQIVSLVAATAVKGMKPSEAIGLLGASGLDRNLIAQIVGTTPNTVSVRLSEAKAKKAPQEKKTAAAPASVSSDEKA